MGNENAPFARKCRMKINILNIVQRRVARAHRRGVWRRVARSGNAPISVSMAVSPEKAARAEAAFSVAALYGYRALVKSVVGIGGQKSSSRGGRDEYPAAGE